MDNTTIARMLENMADLLELKGDNPFKVRAYRKAASNIESLALDVGDLVRVGEIEQIPGIGKDLAQKVAELVTTGRLVSYDDLKADVPETLLEVLQVPGLGPKKVKYLFDNLGITDIEGLERAAGEGKLESLPGFGVKTVHNILEGIDLIKQNRGMTLLTTARRVSGEITGILESQPGVDRVAVAGSLRRCCETVRDVDILVASTVPEMVLAHFLALPRIAEVISEASTRTIVRDHEGVVVDLVVVDPENFGAALLSLTGSGAHVTELKDLAGQRGLRIDEYGVFRNTNGEKLGGREEEEIYRTLDLPLIVPEIREGTGEIDAAMKGELPVLVELADIRGDLHMHTELSDGLHALEEIVEFARGLGYEYIAVTEHSKSLRIAGGITESDLRKQIGQIRKLNEGLDGFRVLAGIEVDILTDGSLDFSDEVLAECDIVIASVHSAFRQPEAEMTARIVKAFENPHVDVFAHPTGRLLGQRNAYEVDMEGLMDAALRTGTALEINAHPMRLDLTDRNARIAREMGVKIVISTDMHGLDEFHHMDLGVSVARRAWCSKNDILNTGSVDNFLAALSS